MEQDGKERTKLDELREMKWIRMHRWWVHDGMC
jgi:hypothetical protein